MLRLAIMACALVLLGGCARWVQPGQSDASGRDRAAEQRVLDRRGDRPALDRFLVPDAGCPKPFTACDAICTDLSSDREHCGGCNAACPVGTTDRCSGAACRCGSSPPCGAGLTCVDGACACVAKSARCPGCCASGACISEGAACSDGDLCTTGDLCTKGACVGKAVTCSDLDDPPCVVGVCEKASGKCVAVQKTGPCDDGLYCTVNDSCQGGVCKSGATRECGGTCVSGSCDEATDQCVVTPKPDGTLCDDGHECTTGDACSGGSCAGTPKSQGAACGGMNQGGCCDSACCQLGASCCGGDCCGLGQICCTDHCCATGSSCCGKGCCTAGQGCCPSGKCCNAGQSCCGDSCCNIGLKCCAGSTCKAAC